MEFKHLQSFAAVVRHKSFSKAAEELFLSQPTISMHIRQLEEELKTVLLARTTKSLELTPTGQEVYDYAVSILSLRERMKNNCGEPAEELISIGASTVPSAYLLPDVLAAYRKQNPAVRFSVDQGDSRIILERLKDGLCDLGVIGMDPEDPRILATPFFRDTIVLIAPCAEPFLSLRDKKEAPLQELLKAPMILREEGSASKYTADLFLKNTGIDESALNIAARVSDPEAIKKMVALGMGVSVMSVHAAEQELTAGRLLAFPFPGEGCHRSFYLLQRKDSAANERIRQFARFLLNYYNMLE